MTRLAGLCLLTAALTAQQVSDTEFKPPIDKPAFPAATGPVIAIDEAHNNFHTRDGRYLTFANLLERDGYKVVASKSEFRGDALKPFKILVIANALSRANPGKWEKPVEPGFTDEEAAVLEKWVRDGGSLWMMIDHFPMPGVFEPVTRAFHLKFLNGYVVDEAAPGPLVFSKEKGTLKQHPVTDGVDMVATFTGSAFQMPGGVPLLEFPAGPVSQMVERSYVVTPDTARIPVKGWLQGGLMRHGKGRLAVFGEAAMFSAQLGGPNRAPMGMNAPVARENPTLLRRVALWLAGGLGDK
ncbi:MAG: hypothetical protein K2X35_07590 [Bryobacteraceae bacterium]|nr:hypothetical protein [Bryobacteraceae bacterium]